MSQFEGTHTERFTFRVCVNQNSVETIKSIENQTISQDDIKLHLFTDSDPKGFNSAIMNPSYVRCLVFVPNQGIIFAPNAFESIKNAYIKQMKRQIIGAIYCNSISHGIEVYQDSFSVNNLNKVINPVLFCLGNLSKPIFNENIETLVNYWAIRVLSKEAMLYRLNDLLYSDSMRYDSEKLSKELGIIENAF